MVLHEVAPVVPVAVTGEKDAMEAEAHMLQGDTIPAITVIKIQVDSQQQKYLHSN